MIWSSSRACLVLAGCCRSLVSAKQVYVVLVNVRTSDNVAVETMSPP